MKKRWTIEKKSEKSVVDVRPRAARPRRNAPGMRWCPLLLWDFNLNPIQLCVCASCAHGAMAGLMSHRMWDPPLCVALRMCLCTLARSWQMIIGMELEKSVPHYDIVDMARTYLILRCLRLFSSLSTMWPVARMRYDNFSTRHGIAIAPSVCLWRW